MRFQRRYSQLDQTLQRSLEEYFPSAHFRQIPILLSFFSCSPPTRIEFVYNDINRSVSDTAPGEEMAVGLPWWHDCIHTPFDLARSPASYAKSVRRRRMCFTSRSCAHRVFSVWEREKGRTEGSENGFR